MIKSFKLILLKFLLMIGLTSCVFSSHLISDDFEGIVEPSDAKDIQVYSTKKVPFKYEIIGNVLVSADVGENSTRLVKLMKDEAAKIGADAIIELRLEFDYGGWSTALKGNGYAVKKINE